MASVRITREQARLLCTFADAYEQPHPNTGQKEALLFYTAAGTHVQHHGLPDEVVAVSLGDLEELDAKALIAVSYGRTDHDGSFRVTGDGYDAVAQIREQEDARAKASVVPPEGARMGLDWPTQVLPVLEAVHELWSRDPSERGVSQEAINAHLGRDEQDRLTSVVLRKLEEGGWVRTTLDVEDVEGPAFCEPTTKAFEWLARWPTERGEAALARLIEALEAGIEQTDDPQKKSKLRKVLTSVQDVGEGVMAGVLTRTIMGEGSFA